jgi:hypothetical protein
MVCQVQPSPRALPPGAYPALRDSDAALGFWTAGQERPAIETELPDKTEVAADAEIPLFSEGAVCLRPVNHKP